MNWSKKNPDWPYQIGDIIQNYYTKECCIVIDNQYSHEAMEIYLPSEGTSKPIFKIFLRKDFRKVA